MKLIYEQTQEGQAINLRICKDNYVLTDGELEVENTDKIPDPDTLSTQAFLATRDLKELRIERDRLLKECDWTQLLTARLTTEEVTSWNLYRDELFNFPSNVDLAKIIWPTKPL